MLPTHDGSCSPDCATTSLTRGQFLRRGVVAAGAVAAYGLVGAGPAWATRGGRPKPFGEPRPIPGGFDANFIPVPVDPFIHALPPAVGFDMSTITDFKGFVAGAEVQGTATGSDGSSYWFDADMRIIDGVYVDMSGRVRQHAFGFV
jgi:hypothetical protein